MSEKITDQFIAEYGQELYEELFENIIGDRVSENIYISDIVNDDVINRSGKAFIQLGEDEVVLRWIDGNWMGSLITEYALNEDVKPYKKMQRAFKLAIAKPEPTAGMINIFNIWKKLDWFIELEGKINYDLYFSPTDKIREHYEGIAAKRGLMIVSEMVEID